MVTFLKFWKIFNEEKTNLLICCKQ